MEKFVIILIVGMGGFVGAVSRYTLTGIIHRLTPSFLPTGTLVVNVIGCLLIGVLMSLISSRELVNEPMKLFLITGILGSLTTFSTFGYETIDLFTRQKLPGLAMINIAGNLLLGFAAVWLGHQLATISAGS